MSEGVVTTDDGIRATRNVGAIRATLFIAFGGILFGYDDGVINGVQAMPNWLCTFGKLDSSIGQCAITSPQQAGVVSSLPGGACFGALLAGPTADLLGRRWSTVLGLTIFSVGVSLQVASTALPLFIVGRVISGVGLGFGITLIPIYQSECAPKSIRGTIVSFYEWVLNVGNLISAIVNNATKGIPSHASWRIPISIQLICAFILAVGIILLPESPRWLIKRKRDEDAARALSRLISLPPDHPELQAELEEIRLSFQREQEWSKSSYLDCFRPSHHKVRLRTWTAILVPTSVAFTGITFISFYGTVFFASSGVHNPFLITIAIGTILAGMTIPGLWGIEKFGRRRLLLVGGVGMSVCQFLVAIIGVTISTSNAAGQKVLVSFVCIFIAFFASTWAPVCWVLPGEITPLNLRAKAMSLAMASGWFWQFVVGYITPYLVNKGPDSAGLGVKVFFIWGTTCVGCFLLAYFCVPETKGLSLEQINLLYQNTTPRRSVSYRRQLECDGVVLVFKDAQAIQDSNSDYEKV